MQRGWLLIIRRSHPSPTVALGSLTRSPAESHTLALNLQAGTAPNTIADGFPAAAFDTEASLEGFLAESFLTHDTIIRLSCRERNTHD